jgi:hypothetical protein
MKDFNSIGITEGADPTVNFKWLKWVKARRPAILITKRPDILTHYLHKDFNVIVHCTITGLGHSAIEPYIDDVQTSLQAYHDICKFYTPVRVVLRIDPIIYWGGYAPILKGIASESEGRTRISFLDLYPHVAKRLADKNIKPPYNAFHMPLEVRQQIWNELGKPEVCCEPDMPSVPCVSKTDCEILGVDRYNNVAVKDPYVVASLIR